MTVTFSPLTEKKVRNLVLFIEVSEVMKTLCKDGLKGQKAISPGHHPGYNSSAANALQGQKNNLCNNAFALSGRSPY
jgi:hypothetical protein